MAMVFSRLEVPSPVSTDEFPPLPSSQSVATAVPIEIDSTTDNTSTGRNLFLGSKSSSSTGISKASESCKSPHLLTSRYMCHHGHGISCYHGILTSLRMLIGNTVEEIKT